MHEQDNESEPYLGPEPEPEAPPTLIERAQQAPITSLLIAIDVLVFIAMSVQGDSTENRTLIAFGASARTLVLDDGEWWRLGSSMFLHIGIMHLLMNSWAAFSVGGGVEPRLGKLKYLGVYLAAGISGAAASTIYRNVLSAGASGAIFGTVGAMLILRQRELGAWGALVRDGFAKRVFLNVALWTLFASQALNVDNAAHLGGFVIGAALTWGLTAPERSARIRDTALAVLAFATLTMAAIQPW